MKPTSIKLKYYVACFQRASKSFSALCNEMSRVSCPSRGFYSHGQRSALHPLCPTHRPGASRCGCVVPTQFRGGKPLPLAERLTSLESLCYLMRSAAGKGCSTLSSRNFFA